MGAGLITLFLISVIVYVATTVLPGNPARSILGRNATPGQLASLDATLHLNQPVVQRYMTWLGSAISGNFGTSLSAHEPVSRLLATPLTNSAVLVVVTMAIVAPLSLALGSVAALRRDGLLDQILVAASIILNALPLFVIGIAVVVLLSTNVLHLLPAVDPVPPGTSPLSRPLGFVLPLVTLVLSTTPYLVLLVRTSVSEVLQQDFVQMCRLRGLAPSRVMLRHVIPNAAVPFVQGLAVTLAFVAGEIVVLEYLFAYPGIGGLLLESITGRDVPAIQAVTLIIAALYVTVNLAADIVVFLLSPRARTSA